MLAQELQGRLWRAVRRSVWAIVRVAVGAALAALLAGETLGAVFNGGHFTAYVHLVSLLLALVAAYGAAFTTGVVLAARGIFGAVTDIETELRRSFTGGPAGWQTTIDAEPGPHH